jgi:hypothetical protein
MGKKYKINLFDLDSYDKTLKDFNKLKNALASPKFMEFIAEKSIMELSRISNERLGGIKEDDVTYEEVDKYRSNHKVQITEKSVRISNNTMADLSHLSDRTLNNYPDGISIAQLIEFGMGVPRNSRR